MPKWVMNLSAAGVTVKGGPWPMKSLEGDVLSHNQREEIGVTKKI